MPFLRYSAVLFLHMPQKSKRITSQLGSKCLRPRCKIWHVGSNGVGLTLSTLDRMDASSISRLQSLAVSSCGHIAHRAKSARRSITWGGSVHAMARAASSMRPRRSVFLAHSIYTVDAQSIGMLAAHPRAPVLPTAITVRWSTRTVPIY